MWGHVKYELKTRAAPLYAARDRETANTTNKTHPSPASRPHVPRLPERLRPLGGEAVRQRRRRRARGPCALPPPTLGAKGRIIMLVSYFR